MPMSPTFLTTTLTAFVFKQGGFFNERKKLNEQSFSKQLRK